MTCPNLPPKCAPPLKRAQRAPQPPETWPPKTCPEVQNLGVQRGTFWGTFWGGVKGTSIVQGFALVLEHIHTQIKETLMILNNTCRKHSNQPRTRYRSFVLALFLGKGWGWGCDGLCLFPRILQRPLGSGMQFLLYFAVRNVLFSGMDFHAAAGFGSAETAAGGVAMEEEWRPYQCSSRSC